MDSTQDKSAQPNQSRLVVDDRFALDFYGFLSRGAKVQSNICFSPWSIENSFCVAYEGARGKTAEELAAVLGIQEDAKARRVSARYLISLLQKKGSANLDDALALACANALWIQQGFKVNGDFIEKSMKYYDCLIDNVDFKTVGGIDRINEWVSSVTKNKIMHLIKPGTADGNVVMFIGNAVYFKANWVYKFDKKATTDADFSIDANRSVKTAMMCMTGYLSYAETDNAQLLELPYRGGRVSMFIILPKLRNDESALYKLSSLESSFTTGNLKSWKSMMRREQVILSLPRFTLDVRYDLLAILKVMGIRKAFEPEADFSAISKNLFIGGAVHKTFLELNEEGTEAAAATVIQYEVGSLPPERPPVHFDANHPFVFFIQDNDSQAMLFVGRIIDPTERIPESVKLKTCVRDHSVIPMDALFCPTCGHEQPLTP
jgi:serpin B